MYPPIRATDLVPFRVIADFLKADPGYLDAKDCPYSPEVRDFLRTLAPTGAVAAAASLLIGDDQSSFDVVLSQIDAIYKELNDLRTSDPGEQIQISKAKAGLLEKLLALRERTLSVRNISGFKKAVLKATDILPPADRTRFIDALEGADDA